MNRFKKRQKWQEQKKPKYNKNGTEDLRKNCRSTMDSVVDKKVEKWAEVQ